jgi:hypothetical protein
MPAALFTRYPQSKSPTVVFTVTRVPAITPIIWAVTFPEVSCASSVNVPLEVRGTEPESHQVRREIDRQKTCQGVKQKIVCNHL